MTILLIILASLAVIISIVFIGLGTVEILYTYKSKYMHAFALVGMIITVFMLALAITMMSNLSNDASQYEPVQETLYRIK